VHGFLARTVGVCLLNVVETALGVLNDYALYKSTHSLTHRPESADSGTKLYQKIALEETCNGYMTLKATQIIMQKWRGSIGRMSRPISGPLVTTSLAPFRV